ncbi:hypothetical protein [Paraburkholderia sp. DHOC27]|uniref:hypothetical protein n=1 Tax=Paraburkholderia sp. DHOC27 TaxID=2303330 RepID=UPI000E3E367C|nr:hypothetical protein [Paraburkholderia sp. DHOC27]RFU46608.1 hypothetical protein D0B32_16455 [Paraburkholderia sp. DHOC27]
MDYSFALKLFAVMLAIFSLALVPFFMRRDPAPVRSIVRIEALPRPQWPSVMTRMGTVTLLSSFVLLVGGCYLLITG